jgi:DNA repair exonuclease SbcCD ATPase subunit
MIITGIEVSGVGRFIAPTRLTGFAPGLNMLCAPNEAGKSTLFKALRTCLFQRHSSASEPIKLLASNDAMLPVDIAVAFRSNGHDYVIHKRFLRGAMALLTRDGVEHARGAQADEIVWEILGVTPGSGRGGPDTGSLGLLWVEQADSFKTAAPSKAAEDELNALISAEVGTLIGGERARKVLERVTESLLERETAGAQQRPRGPLKSAIDTHAELLAQEQALQAQLAELEEDFTTLARIRSDLARRRDPTQHAEMSEQLTAARESFDAGKTAASVLARLDIERSAARDRVESASERLANARAAQKRVVEARERINVLDRDLAEQAGRLGEVEQAVLDAERDLAAAEIAVAELRAEVQRIAAISEALDARERLAEWEARHADILRLTQRRTEIDASLSQLRVTAPAYQEARNLGERIANLEARLEAQAPRLSLTLLPDARNAVTIGGEALRDGHSRALRARTEMVVEGVGTITIQPAEAGAAQEDELSAARRDLAQLLGNMGADSLAAASAALDMVRDLRAERKSVQERIDAASGATGGADAAGTLESRIAGAKAAIAQALVRAGTHELPERRTLHQDRDQLREREATATQVRQRAMQMLQEARETRAGITSRSTLFRSQLTEEQARLAIIEEEASKVADADAIIRRELEHAQALEALNRAQEAFDAQRAGTPDADELEARGKRVERLQQALENRQAEIARLERDADVLEAGIRRIGADGLEERLAAVTAAREIAAREEERARRDVKVLRLLRDTITQTLSEGRARFLAPVKENLRPFLSALFPGAELDLGDDFSPARLTRHQGGEQFASLSDGTKEQIAVLVRLAFGALLARSGRPAPIILDDALVFSDDDRIEGMFDALARSAEHQQVIVLTCRTRAFAAIGGRLLQIEKALG